MRESTDSSFKYPSLFPLIPNKELASFLLSSRVADAKLKSFSSAVAEVGLKVCLLVSC